MTLIENLHSKNEDMSKTARTAFSKTILETQFLFC